MTKCIADPAVSTVTRFHAGKRQNARDPAAAPLWPGCGRATLAPAPRPDCDHPLCGPPAGRPPSSSSCGVIPTIFTNPPAGMAFSPYSVSPRRNENSVGPNPMKYCVAFIPNALAVSRWPNSCSAIDRPMPTANSTTPRVKVIRSLLAGHDQAGTVARRAFVGPDQRTGPFPGPPVCLHNLSYGPRVPRVRTIADHLRDSVHDRRKAEPPGQERGHRLL